MILWITITATRATTIRRFGTPAVNARKRRRLPEQTQNRMREGTRTRRTTRRLEPGRRLLEGPGPKETEI